MSILFSGGGDLFYYEFGMRSINFSTAISIDVSRCSHGALSPCGVGQDAPTERVGYRSVALRRRIER